MTFAATTGSPSAVSVGKLMSVPPPAMAFTSARGHRRERGERELEGGEAGPGTGGGTVARPIEPLQSPDASALSGTMRLPSVLRGNLILALASALVTLVLFVLGYETWQSARYRCWRARYDNKGWLGTLTRAVERSVLMWEYRPHGSHRGIETNRYGFRERDFDSPRKPEGVFRVAFVGDSVTLGLGVAAEQTFERLAEREARALSPEPASRP